MRRERPSVALAARMLAVVVLTPLLVLGSVLAVLLLVPSWHLRLGLAAVLLVGGTVAAEQRRKEIRTRELSVAEAPELHAALERLCVQADLAKPELRLAEGQRQPNSWVTDLPGRAPRLAVTRGLLDLLTPAEVEAVLAHELAHIAHRDATVMTVVGLPGAVLLQGGRHLTSFWSFMWLGGAFALLVGAVASVATAVLSRGRETAADATAARLTGRPSALASALLKMSADAHRLPEQDLRAARSLNAFNVVPVEGRAGKGWGDRLARTRPVRALTATHPTLERRLAQLERLEAQRRSLK